MISFWRIFSLEFRGLVRSRALALLATAATAWMLALPSWLKGDGTAEGARELYVRYSLGGVFTLLVVALIACATGSLAKERAAKRLQLTLVRPVRGLTLVLAKISALVFAGSLVLAFAALLLVLRVGCLAPCSHVLRPVLMSPREEAEALYEPYMRDPSTTDEERRAPKEEILRMLEARSPDHCLTLETNTVTSWTFPLGDEAAQLPLRVRMRFTNMFSARQLVVGEFRIGEAVASVSNYTQSASVVPLVGTAGEARQLSFTNCSARNLMLRPRKDLELLVEADAFGWNLVRAYCELVSILALAIAFGVFLSACLGRPVALFVAVITLIVGELGPSSLKCSSGPSEASALDRIGARVAQAVTDIVQPVAALSPLEKLATDECVEPREVVRAFVLDFLAVPFLLAFLAALVLPHKQLEE